MTGTVRTVGEVLAWTVVLVALWAATLTVVGTLELVVATVCALPCAVLATTTRGVLGVSLRPRAAWWVWCARLPVAVVADTARLAVAVARSVAGGTPLGVVRALTLPSRDDAACARTRAALGTVVVSATPGAYVTGVDRATRTLTLHALSSTPTALERAVQR